MEYLHGIEVLDRPHYDDPPTRARRKESGCKRRAVVFGVKVRRKLTNHHERLVPRVMTHPLTHQSNYQPQQRKDYGKG